ncbi:tyrosine-type recombinase/integrase [Actinotalea fermentans]|uniref:Integrase n=1 Tax=Actinotalea fermentans TaxID=43671 RepID=A0A511YU29_9CELL|nr:tyrosine-type recombinase/integrase [Actinotalea fermentans]KGM17183.1 integrase [Actinotalea fermentans ATCC 43279 = JCM 9966 = DSM 3133]GEN78702.1 integrase [Actinotalea fermentans]
MPKRPPAVDLAALLPSWALSLRAERKSPATVKSYTDGVRGFLAWCEETGTPPVLDKATVNGFTAALLEAGREPATVRSRQLGVRRFAAWLADEGEIPADPLLGIKAPKLDAKVIEPLTDDQIRALLKACRGDDLRDRRDTALIRFMVETGARAGETVALALADVDLMVGVAIVRRGKGGKGRSVPFGPQTGQAIDRYVRARRNHRLAGTPALWLGDRGKAFTYDALHKSLAERAARAGIVGFHPHLLRHTAAHRWLARGGSEGGLMAVAGWSAPDMLARYTRARASERAAAEARGLNLGDF